MITNVVARSVRPRHLRLPDTFPSGTGVGQVCDEAAQRPQNKYIVVIGTLRGCATSWLATTFEKGIIYDI